jgi:tyrosinase
MRVRKDVYQLPSGDQTLYWYARAVERMQALPQADPMSWTYQAAIHGINSLPPGMSGLWAECQHSTSFFLPWHRMYILNFERIVAMHVAELGGPADWALPYWNYTTSDPATLALPPEFRDPTLPGGASNPLYVALRNPIANSGGAVLGPRDVDLSTCLRSGGTTSPGGFFGGPPAAHFGHLPGTLELIPHNAVHVQVGAIAGGLMADPDLAALDPIFWLHHSNIDRLWEVWRNCDPWHQDLTSAYWLTGVPFQFHDATGTLISMQTADVLNLADPLLDYTYSDTSCPIAFRVTRPGPGAPAPAGPAAPAPPGPGAIAVAASATQMTAPQHELVGATRSAVRLGDQVAHVDIPTPVTPHAFSLAAGNQVPAAAAPARQLVQNVTLQLEQVTSSDVAPTYDVFLNVPNGDDPNQHDDRFVGRVAMFGIAQASDPQGLHGGGGQSFAFDITKLYHHLDDLHKIDPQKLRVSFVPVSTIGSPHVTVGRISVYFA